MKLTSLVVLLAATATPAFADEAITASAPPKKTVGANAMAVLPVGDYADVVDAGIGLLARLEVPAGPGFVTGRIGVIFHAVKPDVHPDRCARTRCIRGLRLRGVLTTID